MDTQQKEVIVLVVFATITIFLLVLLLVNLLLVGRNRRITHIAELEKMQSRFREEIAGIRLEVAEATLMDVSRDLHDEVGQLLTFCVLQLENLESQPDNQKPEMIDEIKKSVRDSLDSIRSISRGLNPDFINQQGLVISLEQLFERAALRTGIKTRLQVSPQFNITNITYPVIVYRIIRECLTNAIRHGKATEIILTLENMADTVHIEFHDNGHGISNIATNGPSLGFKTMQGYATLMDGTLSMQTQNEKGTGILLTFPNNI